jgi:hypothetical protein
VKVSDNIRKQLWDIRSFNVLPDRIYLSPDMFRLLMREPDSADLVRIHRRGYEFEGLKLFVVSEEVELVDVTMKMPVGK